jgi:predicted O-linked N-acetylglucosamine transferase (SPINDLY family)
MAAPATDSFDLALQTHRAGDLTRAEHLYRRCLEVNPQHPASWHLLGVVVTHRGRPQEALKHISRAISLQPNEAAFHLNHGVALQAVGRRYDAIASFREALRLQPDFPHAHNNLANAFYEQGDRGQAFSHWRKAIESLPNYVEARCNLARALMDEKQLDEALGHAQQASNLAPNHAPAHRVLANVLAVREEWSAAEASFQQALRLRPEWPEVHVDLADVLQKQDKLAEAGAHIRQALQLNPNYAPAYNQFGIVRGREGQPAEAILHFEQALRLRPEYSEGRHNLALILKMQRRYSEAAVHLREVLKLHPHAIEPIKNLAGTLDQMGHTDEAVAVLQDALRAFARPDSAVAGSPTVESPGATASLHAALATALSNSGQLADSITHFREALRLKPDMSVVHSCLLDALNFDPDMQREELLAEHRRWDAAHGQIVGLGQHSNHDRDPQRRLRIGYLSGDFIRHIAVHFIEPILAHHDPEQAEVFCYADVVAPDARTTKLWSLAAQWRSISGIGDVEVAGMVYNDHIDILVDLGGHTGSRLGVFARRPAPVQVTYLGYPNTTGLSAMNYRLTDNVADPPGEPVCHAEELVRLPGGFCCYAPHGGIPEPNRLPAQVAGFLTFGSLHKLAKLNDRVLELWCDLLRAVPSSRLLLFRDNLRGQVRDDLRRRFVDRGINEVRLVFPDVVPGQNFLQVYQSVDIALDVFPWNGHATACEGLWMGVPVLTLAGNRHAARMVASVLTQLSMTDWIARAPEEYIAKAASWTGRLDELAALRVGLRERMRISPLCDGKRFTRELETAYRDMWERYE